MKLILFLNQILFTFSPIFCLFEVYLFRIDFFLDSVLTVQLNIITQKTCLMN